tara:strand:- start:1166 stop:1465 length:300 start_codon:yes stop_codon:yes gene_type:complete
MADTISVHCANETMGECTPDECDQYRVWLKEQLETRYPDAIVEISSNHSLNGPFYHIDNEDKDDITIGRELELTEELERLVQDLWDNCNWEFLAETEEQ